MEHQLGNLVGAAKGEIGGAKQLAADAFKSKAYFYPFKGIFYFIAHPDLWRPLWLRIGPSLTTAFIVTIVMFFFTYIPQTMIFGIFNGPLALINVFFLVLQESAAITGAITKTMFMERGLVDTFDSTLIEKGSTDIVANGRDLQRGGNIFRVLGRKIKAPWSKFAPSNLISYIMFLPLNLIPVVGTAAFIYIQGKKYGPVLHSRYFQLKRMTKPESEAMVDHLRGAYTAFGVQATLLEQLTPFTGIFFAYTNTVGAALWAHEMEMHLAPDQKLQDIRQTAAYMANGGLADLQRNRDLQGSANNIAGQLSGNLQSQLEASPAAQVAENLRAQREALASGVYKALPHVE